MPPLLSFTVVKNAVWAGLWIVNKLWGQLALAVFGEDAINQYSRDGDMSFSGFFFQKFYRACWQYRPIVFSRSRSD